MGEREVLGVDSRAEGPVSDSSRSSALELGVGRATGPAGVLLLGATIAAVTAMFAGRAAPLWLAAWSTSFLALVAVWLGTIYYLRGKEPSHAHIERRWSPLFRGYALAANCLVAASVFLLVPTADAPLRGLMDAMYLWYLLVQIMAETRSSRGSTSGIVVVLASLMVYEAIDPRPQTLVFFAFYAACGVSLFAFQKMLRGAVSQLILAQMTAERARDTAAEALTEVAEQRDAISRFLASASHDLQQPIQAASLYFDRAIETADIAVRQRAIEGARQAFASTRTLLGQMLEHLRHDTGAVDVRLETVPIGKLLADCAFENLPAAEQADIEIAVVPTKAVARTDPVLLRRIVGNLLANAIAHSGGTKVLLGIRRRGDRLRIEIVDNGCGLESSRDRAHALQGSSAAASAKHYGLGLSTSHRLAAALNGELQVVHRWQRGAWFSLHIPSDAPNIAAIGMTSTADVSCVAA